MRCYRSLKLRIERFVVIFILFTLIPNDRRSVQQIESISLRHADTSYFFAHYRFPKLWYLDLSTGIVIHPGPGNTLDYAPQL